GTAVGTAFHGSAAVATGRHRTWTWRLARRIERSADRPCAVIVACRSSARLDGRRAGATGRDVALGIRQALCRSRRRYSDAILDQLANALGAAFFGGQEAQPCGDRHTYWL